MPRSTFLALFRYSVTLLTTLFLLGTPNEANEPYTPETPLAFADSWRWHELEPLNEYQLMYGAETLEGDLCFTSTNGLVFYDGYDCTLAPYPSKGEDFRPYQIFSSQNGRLYLYTSIGLYSFKDGDWILEKAFEDSPSGINPVMVRSALGVEVLSLPDGFYRIVGRDIILIPEIQEAATEITFDSLNRLWLKVPYENKFVRYQFDANSVSRPIEKKNTFIYTHEDAFPHIIGSPLVDSPVALSWKHSVDAYQFNNELEKWSPENFKDIPGNKQHTTGFHINSSEVALLSKTGLVVMRGNEFTSIEYPEFNVPTNLPFTLVRRNGNIVLGGYGEKIYEIEYANAGYDSYQGLHFQCEDADGALWFVSVGGEIVQNNPLEDLWTKHTHNVIDTPLTIFKSTDGTIWAAGSHRGIAAVCYYDGENWIRNQHPELRSFISHLSCIQTAYGDILFGSGDDEAYADPKGLVLYRKTGDIYDSSIISPPTVPSRPVGLAEIEPNRFWAGGVGLTEFRLDENSTSSSVSPFGNELWIDHLTSDGNGGLWLAIWDRGFFHYDGTNFKNIEAPSSISSNQVIYAHADRLNSGNVWVATNKGISHFNGEHWFPDALPKEIRFSREGGTIRQSNDGALWINIARRDWYFRRTLKFNLTKKMHEGFRTIRYLPDTEAPIARIHPQETQSTSPANIFMQWSGSDKWSKTRSEDLMYSFRTDGGKWSPFGTSTNTVVLDVPAGSHTFEVRSMDTDGNISHTPAIATFSVVPPTWQSPWFIAMMIAIIVTIILLIALLVRQRIQHIIQMDEFKLQFFTNISHELRTPLTVILGPLESQLAKLPRHWDKRPLELAYRNAKKTLNLINQILDFRHAETSTLELYPSHSDIIYIANETINLIRPLADAQSQTLEFEHSAQEHYTWIDSEKFERVLNNLISNAIKYTPEAGRIHISLSITEKAAENIATIVVKDNGCGIPTGKIDSIFEVFYRAGNGPRNKVRGSGIGLAYTKHIVEAFGGSISVESPITKIDGEDRGAAFTVRIPLRSTPPDHAKRAVPTEIPEEASEPEANERPLVLLSEDDQDILEFLEGELSEEYEVITTKDGDEALAAASARIPDLIVTDVMMPGLDGRELCRQLKSNSSTSHIPIIMLTALKSDRHELEGLDSGADDFLSKPVRPPILKKRIHNQLESRQKLRELFQSQKQAAKIEPKTVATNALDEKFLSKALHTVEVHLENPLFDVEFFASEMSMSRMSLYRKFKAITGESPSAYIRSIRMKIASELLLEGEHNITEIAFKVGFSDLSYFSTTFKKHFSKSPREFVKGAKAASNSG
ncbi:ATP-binding protein [Pelagicoccus mobilis]|uniref:histidine kinase n=1 Tax=Pelagicoccus mobilis TaxID=415221 RepID=A0A934RPV4_9BACT|nr:ATP-binding protein [Pelagicoccus mobilis]MBK1875275.1 response regulator [Pelagicoccus mobilis]